MLTSNTPAFINAQQYGTKKKKKKVTSKTIKKSVKKLGK
ncbi:hypothetical protein UFOVP454_29 [uncultured Caudovirales phage]|uniref:Uncharacterized protein n=1 Tax=uncultured Caudovirales phage TaxID=2100421 RepID=A0A6J5MBE8_9CAUD|nr:hypothetical protein UFOVP454_29 [uncultured Caudovirales phage]